MVPSRRVVGVGLVVALWLGLIATGFACWEAYDSTPGEVGVANSATAQGRWELVVFVHPHCPCTRASLSELAAVIHATGSSLGVRVVFVRPDGLPEGWEQTDLWSEASKLPGVRVSCDSTGEEARRAGAKTSGHAVLFDPAGQVAFHGGITGGRGRQGESAGRRAILALVTDREPAVRETPVFGCPLLGASRCPVQTKEGVECR